MYNRRTGAVSVNAESNATMPTMLIAGPHGE